MSSVGKCDKKRNDTTASYEISYRIGISRKTFTIGKGLTLSAERDVPRIVLEEIAANKHNTFS